MLLETIALLLPFIVLGLIGLFTAMLLIEVQKQHKTTRKRVRESIPLRSIVDWLIFLFFPGVIIYSFVYSMIPLNIFILCLLALWGLSNSVSDSQQQQQPYQRVPVVNPKRNQSSPVPFSRSPSNNSYTPSKPASPQRNSIFQRHRPNPLQEKLLAMLNGDRAGAERLLRHAKQMNPGRDEDWYFDKVIYDIERDRR